MKRRTYRWAFFFLAVGCWSVLALAASHSLDSDGVAYVNIANACAHGNWRQAANLYWSPGYPVLFSFWLRLFRPSPHNIIGAVRWFDLLCLVGTLFCFELFLSALRRHRELLSGTGLSDGALTVLAYTVFFWTTCYLTPPGVNPPDILVFASLLLAGAIGLRIVDGADGWINHALLGIILGLGYLAKAVLFPIAFVVLASIALSARKWREVRRLVASLLFFILVAGPFVFALSRKTGHPTFGSAGTINYAESVDHADGRGYWRGQDPRTGVPLHPVRVLISRPIVYEYGMADGGSLPLWTHHGYWYDGIRARLEIGRQINVIHVDLINYFRLLVVPLGPLLAVLLLAVAFEGRIGKFARRFWNEAVLWLPAAAGFGLYALVHVEGRFLSGFVILLLAAVCVAIRLPEWAVGKGIDRSVALAVVVLLGLQIALAVGHSADRLAAGNPFPAWQVANEMHQEGIEAGDKVCYLGDPVWNDEWALVAQVQIVCNMPAEGVGAEWSPDPLNPTPAGPLAHGEARAFWSADSALRAKILAAFQQAGAKAVVAIDVPPGAESQGWKRAGDSNYFVLALAGRKH